MFYGSLPMELKQQLLMELYLLTCWSPEEDVRCLDRMWNGIDIRSTTQDAGGSVRRRLSEWGCSDIAPNISGFSGVMGFLKDGARDVPRVVNRRALWEARYNLKWHRVLRRGVLRS
ncbi:hypothetical protein NDU88_006480 [Pleurodeles waltl]|uniref:Uncharacterized protein n=1 Tax=Pleurodeles waltl TaxID=8319 RepID=A0AAV7N8R9_PLEWA|nr:hypothetical protein NDU88_006480 [Pleurodeles waltl]